MRTEHGNTVWRTAQDVESVEFAVMTATSLLKGDPFAVTVIKDSAEALVIEGVARVKGALGKGRTPKD